MFILYSINASRLYFRRQLRQAKRVKVLKLHNSCAKKNSVKVSKGNQFPTWFEFDARLAVFLFLARCTGKVTGD